MNIQLLTPKLFAAKTQNNQNTNNVQNPHYSNTVMPSKLSPLKADTVSFGQNAIGGAFRKHYESQQERLVRLSTNFLDGVQGAVFDLSDKGFSMMDKNESLAHAVKSAEAWFSKLKRSGKVSVPDVIRTTVFCDDIYNLSKLNDDFLPAMDKRGYIIAPDEVPISKLMERGYVPTPKEVRILKIQDQVKRGEDITPEDMEFFKKVLYASSRNAKKALKAVSADSTNPDAEVKALRKAIAAFELKKEIPDLDIRLKDVSAQVTALDSQYRYCIGKPQKSGYEDIQMRLIRKSDTALNPVRHELLILSGENYQAAKLQEYTEVYRHIRLFDEMALDLEFKPNNPNAKKARRYIDLINQMFRGKVSEKLFTNAMNKDLASIDEPIKIKFDADDKKQFEKYFKGLKDEISSIYALMSKGKPKSRKLSLEKQKIQDLELIKGIEEGLSDTINKYLETPTT